MSGIPGFMTMTMMIAFLTTIVSLVVFKRKSLILPYIVLALSIILLIISFSIGSWEGMGLGVFSLALFMGAFISLIVLTFYEAFKKKKGY
ncbi:CHASE2 domain-containing sensor protein [Bacillus thermophilus]|uniref:CHASE2 domain-containing sensor protein n=1 Tax=Siminovitchia thermophila TaxID=1245522 RepID=A0ABS2R676_9BACI|nr:YesK family protein [Siminovitchia thermophila]MBM7715166.1 CHASE2 domain-containing sensor protein [Siminovitchia thermophila]